MTVSPARHRSWVGLFERAAQVGVARQGNRSQCVRVPIAILQRGGVGDRRPIGQELGQGDGKGQGDRSAGGDVPRPAHRLACCVIVAGAAAASQRAGHVGGVWGEGIVERRLVGRPYAGVLQEQRIG